MKDYGYKVDLTEEALEQLIELFLFKCGQSDLLAAIEARDAIEEAIEQISRSPYIYPIADNDPTERKLVIPFVRKTGYIALFSIESESQIYLTNIRHQLQDDVLR
ncbi:type II toxin-antitoxin system RelE/ParE family toxin [Solimicrobium silvestre]|uniref:Plasmid stabilization system protein n=1 Tax=Solimicrobium silvestre TaxID=2099400 RepID=A0A2S9GZ43_9BURK|nr:type II toxin-antitoxin system RelE/ParE family toxin [Solimicrobium silvestre]PRC92995.1 Plasmid stabilization system protein [Solimicrobium silvestre]